MQAISPLLTGHGGRIDDAAALYPDAPRPWLDLSTGINPRPWRPAAPIEVDPCPLPSRADLRALEAAAARHFGVAPARLMAVPGSEIALRLVATMGVPGPIASVLPGYGTYADIADILLNDIGTFSGRGTLLAANPNNPDGRLLPPDLLMSFVPGILSHLVIDEAFADAGHSLLPAIDPEAPVIVLRSFGKYFGLAGIRLGFVIAPPPILVRLRALLGDWPVSAHAIAYGRAAYADSAWIAPTRADLAIRSAALDVLLARHRLTATGACPLFRLIDTPDAALLFDRLAHAGILVRPFADRPTWLRFGLPADDAAFARLDRALADG
ncbi:aminotransferase class I/II-fold pyridoxal phosphate-dependent enzyme [Sphingomonas sp. BIUV-7]|uniref:Aminotransferase n=1 Tax=Sphingomonas natans TaxID=3063330 RepID=A0ABT8Y4T9_9SPHN|nr:aminotransferase class I/II-fold pyridoxal phosphate-dependent enzyme [Sphingomonas sp. BIUV-7]MDO6413334.1 aminotransferase class I/II-fold pyridoxal phosphate-dependent enzyme [Sphingomonas sp. BIUV-7]